MIYFFSRERFDHPLCNMQKWKAAYLWYERTYVFWSRLYCTLFVIVLLQWKVIVRDPVCQRARVFLPLGLVHGCADTSVWSKAPLTSWCLSSRASADWQPVLDTLFLIHTALTLDNMYRYFLYNPELTVGLFLSFLMRLVKNKPDLLVIELFLSAYTKGINYSD